MCAYLSAHTQITQTYVSIASKLCEKWAIIAVIVMQNQSKDTANSIYNEVSALKVAMNQSVWVHMCHSTGHIPYEILQMSPGTGSIAVNHSTKVNSIDIFHHNGEWICWVPIASHDIAMLTLPELSACYRRVCYVHTACYLAFKHSFKLLLPWEISMICLPFDQDSSYGSAL